MPAIPASTKSSITLRVLDHAKARWPQLHKIETSYRGAFAYITGVLWLAPDLPGHGGSRPLSECTFDNLAAAVAGVVGPDARAVVLGHSLGGVVGLSLASRRFGVPVRAVIGLEIKVVCPGTSAATK
jgi:pimeloyl-ACP methyl ester carboxylesterase